MLSAAAVPPPVAVPPEAPASTASAASLEPGRWRPPGHEMVVTGVSLVSLGVASYVGLAVSLVVWGASRDTAGYLRGQDDDARLREVEQRVHRAEVAAIATGVTAGVLSAVGIPLIVVGRRRAVAHAGPSSGPTVGWGVGWLEAGGVGLTARGRF